MDSIIQLIHTPLYGEMLLAIAVLGFFARQVLASQDASVGLMVHRCALSAFGLYIAVRILGDGVGSPGTLITYAFRGFVAAGLTFCFTAFTFSAVATVGKSIIQPAWVRYQQAIHNQQMVEQEKRENEERLKDAEASRAADDAGAEEHRIRSEAIEQVRFDLRVFYESLPAEARHEFSPKELDQYFGEFIHTGLTPADVLKRAAMLRKMLTDRAESVHGPLNTIESIVAHFQERCDEVAESGLPEDQIDSLLSELKADQARMIRDLRERESSKRK